MRTARRELSCSDSQQSDCQLGFSPTFSTNATLRSGRLRFEPNWPVEPSPQLSEIDQIEVQRANLG